MVPFIASGILGSFSLLVSIRDAKDDHYSRPYADWVISAISSIVDESVVRINSPVAPFGTSDVKRSRFLTTGPMRPARSMYSSGTASTAHSLSPLSQQS